MYYAAYGSNLNLEQMKYRCPDAKAVGSFKLDHLKLCFRGHGDGDSYLTVEPGSDNIPFGLYDISNKDMLNLDKYEGYPEFYDKKYLHLDMRGKEIVALTYIMKHGYGIYKPSQAYINTVLEGYNDFAFDEKIITKTIKGA